MLRFDRQLRSDSFQRRTSRAVSFALALIVLLAPLAALGTTPAAASGDVHFVALVDDGAAVFTNPAGLLWLDKRNLRLEVTSLSAPGLTTRSFVYSEPDMGVGAGALSYLSSPAVTRYMYTVARKAGPASAIGANLKYETTSAGSWWGLDLGYRYVVTQGVQLGFAVENAISSRGRAGRFGPSLPRRSPSLRVGASLSQGGGLFLAGDYYDPDLDSHAAKPVYRIIAGLVLGSMTIWGGQETSEEFSKPANLLGIKLKLDLLHLDMGLRRSSDGEQTLTVGLAYHF